MKKQTYLLIISFLVYGAVQAQDQADEVRKRLKEFKMTEDRLSANLREEDAVHYYKIKSVTGSMSGNVTSMAEYDPRRKSGSRTKLLTVNGQPPTKKEAKKYNKRFGKKGKYASGKIDPASYEIIKDNADWFVIKFRFIKESLPERYAFLGDCDAELHCRKDVMLASYGRFKNFQETKVKMFEADKVDIEIYLKYEEATKTYLHEEARYYMDAKIMGIPTEVELLNYYSDYKLVK
jgi:hypothetical protein